MTFEEILDQAIAMLQRRGRLTYRTLKRQFQPEDKRLLQTAAVLGTDVPFALLWANADLPEEALQHGLAHLQAVEFLSMDMTLWLPQTVAALAQVEGR
jgi:hypothetical protein